MTQSNIFMSLKTFLIVRGLSLQKHRDCSNCSTSTIFGPEVDVTISCRFLEGAKLGSLYVGHFGSIQDGGLPEYHMAITGQPKVVKTCVIPCFWGFRVWGIHFS